MKNNMATFDRILRVIISVIFSTLYALGIVTGTLGIVLIVLSVVFLLTSVVNFCPLYAIFGISTKKSE